MICFPPRPSPRRQPPPDIAKPRLADSPADGSGRAYGLPFWAAYAANTLVMVAVALLYRYADFVTLLGGTEFHLGWIVGVGMIGSVVMRLFLGSGIDHHGPRLVWLASLAVLVLTCFAHLGVTDHNGVAIYLLRIVFCTALAGIFGASTTFISGGASVERMAELIGMLGTSGFVGIMLGTQLGDFLCGTATIERWQVDLMFLVAGLLVTAAIPFAWRATRHQLPPVRQRRTSMTRLVERYHPGMILLVGAVSGAAISLPSTFLRPYAAELDIARIGLFFTVCGLTAVITRVLTRRLPERFGLPPIILFGLAVMAVSQFLLLLVRTEWQLVVPGVSFGIAQAILFPMVTAAGSSTFPHRHRGLGITLTLAAFDVGQLVGAPLVGVILHVSQSLGWPSYSTMFTAMAAALALVGAVYAAAPTRKRAERERGGLCENNAGQGGPLGAPPIAPPSDGNTRWSGAGPLRNPLGAHNRGADGPR